MPRLFLLATLSLLCTASLSCESLNIPPAPDLQPVLNAYENPSAVVDGEIMGAVADEIAKAAEEIEDSEIFEEILNVIIEVQQELEENTAKTCNGGAMNGMTCDTDADCPDGTCVGELVFNATCNGGANDKLSCVDATDCPGGTCGGGVTFPSPNGGVRVKFICNGWDERQFDPDYLKTCNGGANDGSACADEADCPDGICVEANPPEANGLIELFMTLDSGGIGRVVWGTAAECLYLVPIDGIDCEDSGCSEASYNGDIALDLGDTVPPGEDIEQLPVTFVIEGKIGFDGGDFDINQSFRVVLAVESGLEILVDIGEQPLEETFNYFFLGTAQGLRAKNGTFACSLEDMQCSDASGPVFSW